MPFPNVPRKSNVEAETFDLRAYVNELIQALALGIGGLSLFVVLFLWASELREPDEHDRYLSEIGPWCIEHMPDAKAGECFDKTGY